MAALGLTAPPAFPPGAHERCTPELGHVGVVPCAGEPEATGLQRGRGVGHRGRERHHDHVAHEMLRYLEPDADRLRCPPGRLLHYIRLLTFAGSHQHLADGVLLTPDEIVDVLLTGVLVPESTTARPTRKAC